MRKRIAFVTAALGILTLALIGRLAYIQFWGHQDLSQAASAQQMIALEGANTRGLIYDRNHTPLVGNNQEYIFIIREKNFDGESKRALNLMGARELKNTGSGYKVFASKSYDKELGQQLIRNSSAYILEAGRRYGQQQKAVHILGYVNPQDASGATGIELMCESQLSLLNKRIFTTADVKGNILQGKGLVVRTAMDEDSYVKEGVVTTLDAGLQGAVEDVLRGSGKNGAIVVLKRETGEIVASASTPVFDPNRVSEYMSSDKNELVNKVTQGTYPPGSVFKIVLAAAAAEQGISPDKTFVCKGYEMINGQKVICKTGGEEGHGTITLRDALAQSCNSTFIQLGQELGAETILQTAKKMGLGEMAIKDYPGQKEGKLMTLQQSQGAAIANLSIGQGETLATPLQIARMTNIIANGGIDPGVHILLEDGETQEKQAISSNAAEEVRSMMEKTMSDGTGKSLTADVSMAGKTGSAEASLGGKETVHGWMTGFAPAQNPEYTITVFVENGQSGSQSAGPLFAQVVQYLSDSKSFERPLDF